MALTSTKLTSLPKIAEGKVRDLYEIDKSTLLFVATDRISAYDVIMDNVSSAIANPNSYISFLERSREVHFSSAVTRLLINYRAFLTKASF
jgi:phosphoribosylaminoimidazole-succinocarboxamide synthase